ncbi:MAG: hypothetical protein ACR2OI_01560 [Acidimicrobiia bacterium]
MSTWILVGLFALLAVAHVVLTVLFYLGIHDQGFGFVFGWEWPAWLITIMDGSAAWMFWYAYRRCEENPWLGVTMTLVASTIAVSRALWMVFAPVLVLVVIAVSISRVVKGQPLASRPSGI